jgi:hypothetical protein
MSLDHGILNTPLANRGDTLFGETRKQFESRQKTEAKAKHRAYVALMAEAKGLIEMVSDERMAELGKPHDLTARQCRKQMHNTAWRAPQSVVTALRKEIHA